jgi:hypothetical protein
VIYDFGVNIAEKNSDLESCSTNEKNLACKPDSAAFKKQLAGTIGAEG